MKHALIVAALIAFTPVIASANVTRAQALMGTVCEITVPDGYDRAIDGAFEEAHRIEMMLSTWTDESDLAGVNKGRIADASHELRALLANTIDWAHRTDSAFNPLVGPLVQAWQTRGNGAIPSQEALTEALEKSNIANAVVMTDGIIIKNGAQFEEGGFGKGYAIDRMLGVLRQRGAPRGRINFGGEIGVYGDQPFVTIADPLHRDTPAVGLLLANTSISTSSGSEKSFKVGDRVFTHIIDPRNGEALPPRGSVSVIHRSPLIADILSTALYVMGPEAGMKWAKENHVIAIFITDKNEVVTSVQIPALQMLDAKFTLRK